MSCARVGPVLASVATQLEEARAEWQAQSRADPRVRLGGAFVGGALLGRVVRRVAR